jgi:hypothetical protein
MLGIIVDWGNPNDPPDTRTVCGLGARMLGTLPEILRQNGAKSWCATLHNSA